MPHVASRVDRFLNPDSGDTYQIDRALDAFHTGGFFGRGPGEGEVKRILPDAHTDFILPSRLRSTASSRGSSSSASSASSCCAR